MLRNKAASRKALSAIDRVTDPLLAVDLLQKRVLGGHFYEFENKFLKLCLI